MIYQTIQEELVKGTSKKIILDSIAQVHTELDEVQLKRVFREAQISYYNNLKRIPPEALINKITEEYENLKDEIRDTSAEDITKQAQAINKLDETVLKINKVLDVPAKVEININTNVDPDDLVASSNKIIDLENEENNDK